MGILVGSVPTDYATSGLANAIERNINKLKLGNVCRTVKGLETWSQQKFISLKISVIK